MHQYQNFGDLLYFKQLQNKQRHTQTNQQNSKNKKISLFFLYTLRKLTHKMNYIFKKIQFYISINQFINKCILIHFKIYDKILLNCQKKNFFSHYQSIIIQKQQSIISLILILFYCIFSKFLIVSEHHQISILKLFIGSIFINFIKYLKNNNLFIYYLFFFQIKLNKEIFLQIIFYYIQQKLKNNFIKKYEKEHLDG
ncbi:transmembrane protein, putative (macronuclear) [Tetrahymena thermophila SB210]|uniref:Transmembrane protein, putative n=1 Tax=Tetrahymena thermophila (strain SB210) TaxID=312017 RepID=W7XCA2_TETTS|nr:transmembrane protein, putative [Tetrahymena thermophila SB210]EWS71356.1 transmembrane protein, putative [Tetrahymena thermophila SB210]|eukprot:XP_012656108.1 transmembrane protein, putative [Tetrahymena thermophila SB210]